MKSDKKAPIRKGTPSHRKAEVGFAVEPLEARIAPAAVLTATKVDIFTDADGDGKAEPGETITYEVIISNTGDATAQAVSFEDILDPNTTLGGVNVSPLALNDSFTAVSNTLLEVGVPHGVFPAAQVAGSILANDREFIGDTFSLLSLHDGASNVLFSGGTATLTTTDGGTVTMNANGTFTFLPGAGFTGNDVFTYTITDKGLDGIAGNADDLASIGTVTITVQGTDGTSTATAPVVWYVDNSYTGANGPSDGRSTRPFTSLAPLSVTATDPDGTGDTLFVHTGSGSAYTGGITLEASQRLQGQGTPLVINGHTLVSAGTAPTITNSGAIGVALGASNVLRGFTAGAAATAISGTSFGTLDVQNVTINNASGAGLSLNTGSFAAGSSFNSITSGGGVNGIALISVDGPAGNTINLGNGAISGATGSDFLVSGGNVQLTYSGTITNTLGRSIDIANHSTGNITLSGNISDSGAGISIVNNPSGTITFTGSSKVFNTGANAAVTYTGNGASLQFTGGGLDIDTTSGAGINAVGNAGALTVTGGTNTVATGTGTALNVNNTVISALGLTFQSISATGAANGIVLNATGSSGGLTVTGIGTTVGSGGTIQNTSSHAISLNSTLTPSFSRMSITNTGGDGINATSLTTGFNVTGFSITNIGNGDNDNGITLTNVGGTVSIQGTTISNVAEEHIEVNNTNTNLILNIGTVTANTFSQPATLAAIRAGGAFAGNGILITSSGSSNISANVSNSTFTDIKLFGFQFGSTGAGTGNASTGANNNVTLHNNQFQVTITNALGNTNNRANSINIQGFGDIDIDASITNNVLNKGGGGGIQIGADNTADVSATVTGNTISNQFADGILMGVDENATLTVLIDNNQISNTSSDGMEIANFGVDGSSTLNATITNNTVTGHNSNVGGNAFYGGIVVVGGDSAGDNTFLNITGNNVSGNPDPGLFFDYVIDSFGDQVTIQGAGTTALTTADFLAAPAPQNTSGSPAAGQAYITNAFYSDGAAVPTPSFTALTFAPAPGDTVVQPEAGEQPVIDGSGNQATTSDAPVVQTPVIVDDGVLSQTELDSLVDAAKARWIAAGLTLEQTALLDSISFGIADLPGWYLGSAVAGRVVLDLNAGGNAWFIDSTPLDDSEFAGDGTRLAAIVDGGASGRVDALTTILHEIGHQLGIEDSYAAADRADLMYGYLGQGERRLPASGQAEGAVPHADSHSGADFLFAPITIGDLPAGKSVTIQFQATVNDPPLAATVSNRGTVKATGLSDVLTDDPDVGGQQATVTLIDLPDVNVNVSAASVAEDGSGNLVYTFTRIGSNSAPLAVSFSVTGSATLDSSDYTIANGTGGTLSFSAGTGLGTVTFDAGSSTATVILSPTDDVVVETDEAISMTITGGGTTYDIGSPFSVLSSIANDDTDVSVSVSPASVSEDGAGNLVYTFTRTGVTTNSLVVNFSAAGSSTALFATGDYNPTGATSFAADSTGTITFAPGAPQVQLTLNPNADNTVESDENVIVAVTAASGGSVYNIAGTAAQGTITNDDSAVKVEMLAATSTLEDGAGNLVYTFTRTGFLGNSLAVNYQASGTATGFGAGTIDYAVSGGAVGSSFNTTTGAGVLVFAAGSTTATLTVNPTVDTTTEPNETVVITLGGNSATPTTTGGYSLGTPVTATGTILDDDASLRATLDGSGNLTIADISATGANHQLTFRLVNGGASLEISDPSEVFDGVPVTSPASVLSNGGRTLTIPISAVSGSLTINTEGGNDTVMLDLSGGDFINAAGIDFNGGAPSIAPGDKLVISGGAQGTVTYNYTNANDGSVVMSNFGTVRYAGLEPIINSGTATDVIINLPASSDVAFIEDNGATPADGMLRLRSLSATFEQTDFAIPSGSLTINLGAGNDTLTITAAPEFTAGLTINGGTGDDTINLNGAITFASGKNLDVDLQDDDAVPGTDIITVGSSGQYILSGTGAVDFKASRNIQIAGRVATENGDIILENNQQAVAATGDFQGVNVLGTGIVENTGTGHILIKARGGNDAAGQQNGFRTNTGAMVRGGTDGDAVVVVGYGGATAGNGIFIPNGAVRSLGGNILFTGFGAGTNTGVTIQNSGVVSPIGNGNVVITATAAMPTGIVADFQLFTIGTDPTGIFTSGGSITINADSLNIGTTNAFSFIDAGPNGTVTIRPRTAGTNIDIGSTTALAQAGLLDISDAELDRVVAGTLVIGASDSGTINITNNISPAAYKTLSIPKALSFTSGATTGGFDSDVISATDYEKIEVAGAVTIDPAATLNVTALGGFTPSPGDVFTIINNTSASTTTSTFAGKPEGSTVNVGGYNETLTYIGGPGANDVQLLGTTVEVTVAPGSVLESSTTGLVYTFTRTGILTDALPVNFTKSGLAVAADYTATSTAAGFDFAAGTLTIPAGVSSVTVTLVPVDDRTVEGSETATLALATGSGYGILGSPATGTIADNDTATLSFTSGAGTALESVGSQNVGVTLTLNTTGTTAANTAGLASNLTANLTTTGGSATGSGTDYTLSGSPAVTFAAGTYATGTATQNAAVTVIDDRLVEGSETALLGLSIVDGIGTQVSIGGTTAHTLTLTDNDTVTLGFSSASGTVLESAGTQNVGATITINAIGTGTIGLASSLTANLTATGGTATGSGTDYTLPGSPAVTFAPGAYATGTATQNAVVAINDDRSVEGAETVALGLAITGNIGSQASVGGTTAHTWTITDNDTATIAFSGFQASITEGGSVGILSLLQINATGTGTVQLERAVSVTIADLASSTATGGGVDYTHTNATITYDAGAVHNQAGVSSIVSVDDRLVEGSETIDMQMGSLVDGTNGQVSLTGTLARTLTLTDNDTATLSFTSGTGTALESVGTQSVGLILTLNTTGTTAANTAGLASNLTANLTATGGIATGSGTDYTLPGSPAVTFLAGTYATGTATQNAAVTVIDDRLVEGDETVALGLSIVGNIGAQVSIGGTTAHTLTLTDNDTVTLGFTTGTSSAPESVGTQNVGATMTINAIGTGTIGLVSNVTANLTTTGGTAGASGTDYTLPGSPAVTFLAGAYATGTATQNVAVTIVDDRLVEGDETAAFGLGIVGNIGTQVSVGGTTAHNLTLTDNDTATLSFTAGAGTALESAGTQNVSTTLTLNTTGVGTIGLASDLTAHLTATGGTATGSGTDYTLPTSPAVTFLAGAYATGTATQNAAVTVIDDRLVEGTETAALGLSIVQNIGTQVSISGITAHTLTLTDNDTAVLSIEATRTVNEEGGAQNITVTLITSDGAGGTATLAQALTADVVYAGTGSAIQGIDFESFGTTFVTFAAGSGNSATQTVSITTSNDALVEGNETAGLTLQNLNSTLNGMASLGNVASLITIRDNDTATISITPAIGAGETSGSVDVIVTLNTSNDGTGFATLAEGLTIDVADLGLGSAISGLDYSAFVTQALTFVAGSGEGATQKAILTVQNDSVFENPETVLLGLQNLSSTRDGSVSLAQVTSTLTISDNETATIAIVPAVAATEVSGTIQFGVTLTIVGDTAAPGVLAPDVSLSVNVSDALTGSATSGTDYTVFSPQALTFAGGSASGQVEYASLSILDDSVAEDVETVNLSLGGLAHSFGGRLMFGITDTVVNITDTDIDLVVTGAGSIASVVAGSGPGNIVFTFTVTNNGFIDGINLVLGDVFTLPAGVTLISSSATVGSFDGATTWNVGTLAPGATATLTLNLTAAASAPNASVAQSTVSVSSADQTIVNTSDDSATASANIIRQSDLAITKTGTPATVPAGQPLTYTIVVANSGPSDNTSATVTDIFPAGLFDINWTASFTSGSSGSASGSGILNDVVSLAAGGTATYTVTATPVAVAATIDNTATVTSAEDTNAENNSSGVTNAIYSGIYTLSNSRNGGAYGIGSQPIVRVFDVTTGVEAEPILAYEKSYRSGVRVAIADLNGDGFQDIITATRSGTGRIRAFDGVTHEPMTFGDLSQIDAFFGRDRKGAYVAAADVNGDGQVDIIASSGLGGGLVRVFDGGTGELLRTETPFGSKYRGGVRVAAGDVNGDGVADLIAGQSSRGSKVKVYLSGEAEAPDSIEFTAGAARLRDGVFLSTGDMTGDGIAEIIVGRGKAGSRMDASVGIFQVGGESSPTSLPESGLLLGATEIRSIPLSNSTYRFGARVAAVDVNFDGIAEILVAAGPLGKSKVQILDGVTGTEISSLTAFPKARSLGVFVAAGSPDSPLLWG